MAVTKTVKLFSVASMVLLVLFRQLFHCAKISNKIQFSIKDRHFYCGWGLHISAPDTFKTENPEPEATHLYGTINVVIYNEVIQ
jgi:hypothetical protein